MSWWVLVRAGFARHATYRGAMLAGAATNSVFGLLRASILLGALGTTASGSIGGYAAGAAVTYAWVTQALIAPLNLFTWNEVALRVRTGDIAVDLARPVDLQVAYGAADLGRAAAVIIPRGLPTLLVGQVAFGLALDGRPVVLAAAAVSALLGVGISFCCRYLVNLASFWLLDIRGVLIVYVTVSTLLAGLVVPVSWFPSWLHALAALTPFPDMLQAPTDVLVGRVPPGDLLGLLGRQLAWFTALVAGGRLVEHLGTRRLVVQGG